MKTNPSFTAAPSTEAYLAQIPPDMQQRAADYTHGNHWLVLFSVVVGIAINLIVLRLKLLERIGAHWERRQSRPWLAAFVVAAAYFAVAWLLDLPWAAYTRWWREVQFGLGSQSAGAWLGESLISALFSGLMLAVVLMLLYGLIRKAPGTWWIWSSVLTSAMIVFAIVIAPVAIEPLFNEYKPIADGANRAVIESLAAQAGISPDRIVSYDGSRQSSIYTANVTGLFGSARIAVSDALLTQASAAELRAVVGHEIGHFVLHHSLLLALGYSALLTLSFLIVHRLYVPLARLVGAPGLTDLSDPAGIPVLSIIVTVTFFLLTPVTNGMVRFVENQADEYSLEHAREPDGMAIALLRTADYRAAAPGQLEEWLFYDHPSIERRIQRAIDWKAQHPRD